MEFKSLDSSLAKLPTARRRSVERNARKVARRQMTRNMPAIRDLLTQERMQSPESAYYIDQQGNDIALAWYLWAVRDDSTLFAAECRTIPSPQLVHVLFLLRKILRHPDWKLGQLYRPSDEKLANRREHLISKLSCSQALMRPRRGYISDLLRNARRYAGLAT